jgi:sigma-E factor negative regulatory protein RseA
MNPLPADPNERRRMLSELADGETDDAGAGCALWAGDAASRAAWHAYHLIGDVLRSDALAQHPAHDAAFLAAVHARLEREPVVLAPRPAASAARRRHMRWVASASVAAGFAAVGGMLVLTQGDPPTGETAVLAARPPASGPVQQVAAGGVAGYGAPVLVLPQDLKMIRDARLDRYLQAHREVIADAPVAMPGGAMRSVETIVPQR